MPFTFEEHPLIKDLYTITPHLFTDIRGDYKKTYEKYIYTEHGLRQEFTETSEIISNRGVFRGLHFQTVDSQAKLVHVIKGRIFDVAVDLRTESKTFGKWASFLLSDEDNQVVLIPEGFAHGFLALEDNTIFTYQCSGAYRPEYCGGIRWDDADLNIDWPLDEVGHMIMSEKDKHNISIREYQELLKK